MTMRTKKPLAGSAGWRPRWPWPHRLRQSERVVLGRQRRPCKDIEADRSTPRRSTASRSRSAPRSSTSSCPRPAHREDDVCRRSDGIDAPAPRAAPRPEEDHDGVTDVYWEYNGTGWINYLGHDKPITDPQAQYEAVKKEDLAKNKLVWGKQAPLTTPTRSPSPTSSGRRTASRPTRTWRRTSRRTRRHGLRGVRVRRPTGRLPGLQEGVRHHRRQAEEPRNGRRLHADGQGQLRLR